MGCRMTGLGMASFYFYEALQGEARALDQFIFAGIVASPSGLAEDLAEDLGLLGDHLRDPLRRLSVYGLVHIVRDFQGGATRICLSETGRDLAELMRSAMPGWCNECPGECALG